MKNIIPFLFLFFYVQSSFSQDKTNILLEPKNIFKVTTETNVFNYYEGDELILNPPSSKVKIELLNYKKFDSGTVSFHYPPNFAFESDKDFGYTNWSFDGNNVVVLYFEIDNDTKMQEYIDMMIDQFGKKNCKTEKKTNAIGRKNAFWNKN